MKKTDHLKGIKAIAFDLYGTLVYVSDPRRPYNSLLGKMKPAPGMRNIRRTLLTKDFDTVQQFLKSYDPDLTDDLSSIEKDIKTEITSVTLFPDAGILDVLSRSYDLYLISNLSTPYKQPVYNLGIDQYFKKMFFSCECGSIKPQSIIFKLLINETGLNPEHILMVGDNLETDYKGALNCGLNAVLLDRKGNNQSGISSLEDLI